MPLVKYVANQSSNDWTGAISFGTGRVLYLNGDPLEISDAERASVGTKYVLEVVETTVFDATAPGPDASPDVPQEEPQNVEDSPVITGSTPDISPTLPTPPAGN